MIFSIGDIVILKSGGPKMTVERIGIRDNENDFIECIWFADQKVEHDKFVSETLIKKESAA